MLIQRMGHGADGLIMRQVQRPFATAFVLPARPGAVQGVLQDRQLVRVVADVVDQPRQQDRRDLRAAHPDGPSMAARRSSRVIRGTRYCPALMASARPGNWVQSPRKSERIVRTTKIGQVVSLLDLQQQVHEGRGFLADAMHAPAGGPQLPVAKQLFELVHHHQQIDALAQPRLLADVDQSQLAHAQGGLDDLGQRQARRRILTKQHAVLGQGAGHRPIGSLPGRNWAMRQAVPARAIRPRRKAGRSPQLTSEDLPLPEVPTTARKRVAGQLVDHGIDLVLPAEEQMLLILPERPQARKGIGLARRWSVGIVLMRSLRRLMACTNAAIAASAKPSSPSIRPGSSISIRSSLSLVLGSAR